jgi:aspartyl-tRNA(Asn)/glutamyl-tRNA(Gln) amidotransferase subunit C
MLNLPQGDGHGPLHQRGGVYGSPGLLEAECPGEASFSKQLSRILRRVDKLKELDAADVPPTTHVVSLENVCREDRMERGLDPEEALLKAPGGHESFFRVPRAFD